MINTFLQGLLIYSGTDHIQFLLMTSLDFEMVTRIWQYTSVEKADSDQCEHTIPFLYVRFSTAVNKDVLEYYIWEHRTFPISVHIIFLQNTKRNNNSDI